MRTRSARRTIAALGVAGLAVLGVPSTAAGDLGDIEVVATGLDNPRGMTLGPDGAVYVAESGAGGTGPCFAGPEGGRVCYGRTGAVTRVDDDGQERVLRRLSSIAGADGARAIGPSDVAFRGGRMHVTVGLGLELDLANTIPALDRMGQLIRAHGWSNTWHTVADLAEFEDRRNPTGDERDSNPNSVVRKGRTLVVADAGGNDVLRVRRDGSIRVLATLPNRRVDGMSMDEVPTSVAVGPDGAVYVGQLTGFPFPVGGARVYRIDGDGDVDVFADDFTNIVDIGFDEHDDLYVLEMFHHGLLSGDPTGALIRVDEEDTEDRDVVTDDLVTPGGFVIDEDEAYVSNMSTFADRGELLKVDLD